MRYIDGFVLCLQYRADALRVQEVLRKRLGKFGLTLAEAKTKLVEFGRYAQRYASKRGCRTRRRFIFWTSLQEGFFAEGAEPRFKDNHQVPKKRIPGCSHASFLVYRLNLAQL